MPVDGLGTDEDDLELGKFGLRPGNDGLGPGKDGLGPGKDGLGPGKDGLGPGKDGLGPRKFGFRPGTSGLGSCDVGFEPATAALGPGEVTFEVEEAVLSSILQFSSPLAVDILVLTRFTEVCEERLTISPQGVSVILLTDTLDLNPPLVVEDSCWGFPVSRDIT